MAAGSADYNAKKAVEYADAHWNDGVGLCAAFVARCLKAGGLDFMQKGFGIVDNLISRLKKQDYVTVNKLTYNKAYKDDSVIALGDPMAYYCTTCKKGLHMIICTNKTSAGKILYSAHNSAKHNKALYAPTPGNCGHTSGHNIVIYGYHINTQVKTTEIKLSDTTLDVQYLSKFQLSATAYPENATNKKIKWSSSNDSLARVDENGVVTIRSYIEGENEVKITAAPEDGGAPPAVCTVRLHKIPVSEMNIVLEYTSTTYTGKVIKPSIYIKKETGSTNFPGEPLFDVKWDEGRINPGTYAVRIKGNYYFEGEKTLIFHIRGTKMSISSLTPLSKGFKAKWGRKTKNTGYQLQYSTSSKFTTKTTKTVKLTKNTTVSKSITKLTAAKRYYVRIRSYKTTKISGKTYTVYSVWSKAKYITTKK